MISIVLYGRNDSYGYNLHKRAALSINCMSEVLSDADDEVLFVDYNTPDDYPTFPEAIQDTLTDKAKKHLRILRVRPSVHARFQALSQLVALEPIARNVAVRRSNPANRWILSTNTDMIFVPRNGETLTEIAGSLPKGYYGTPRFEIPETLWELLDRKDPRGVIEMVGKWGWQFHMNEIVYGYPFLRFDAPGDFQLIDRSDLFKINGFHESMLVGWHVDANIARRLSLLHKSIGELTDRVFGYHCDHTRQITPMHRKDAAQNSIADFVESVSRPDVPAQAQTWGCAGDEIEEVRLGALANHSYLRALSGALKTPLQEPIENDYVSKTYDKTNYEPSHVLPFVLDLFATTPPNFVIGWFGGHRKLFELFRDGWFGSGRKEPIRVPEQFAEFLGISDGDSRVKIVPLDRAIGESSAFVFDFARADGSRLAADLGSADRRLFRDVLGSFWRVVSDEHDRLAAQLPLRRIAGINTIHNRFERMISYNINTAKTPFSVRIRHGFIASSNPGMALPWMQMMVAGKAGRKTGQMVRSRRGVAGSVAHGPYATLPAGRYAIAARFDFRPAENVAHPSGVAGSEEQLGMRLPLHRRLKSAVKRTFGGRGISLRIVNGKTVLADRRLSESEFGSNAFELEFEVKHSDLESDRPPAIELRVRSNGHHDFCVLDVSARKLDQAER